MKTLSALLVALGAVSLAIASAEPERVHANGVVRVRAHRMAKHHRSHRKSHHARRYNGQHDGQQDKDGQQAQASAGSSDGGDDSKKMQSQQQADNGSSQTAQQSQAQPTQQSQAAPMTSDAIKAGNAQAEPTSTDSSDDDKPTMTMSRSVQAATDEAQDNDSGRDRTTFTRATRTRDTAQAATANADRNKNGMMNGQKQSGMMNGQKQSGEGENKDGAAKSQVTPAAQANSNGQAGAAGGAAALSAAISKQLAAQDAGFSSSSSALAAKFTAASDNNFKGKGSNKVSQDSLCVDKSQLNIASFDKGNPAVGQANSETSKNNFINFCATKQVPLMNGLQQRQLSCNPIPMGMIVPVQTMPTVKWKFPRNNDVVPANKNLTLLLNVKNMQTGVFTDAQGTYFSAPQDVTKDGLIIGHGHFVVNEVNGCQDTTPADGRNFVFFKGIDAAAVDGVLSATVIGGLPPGTYRACSMMSAANHQPVLVSVAQRNNQDDCTCWTAK